MLKMYYQKRMNFYQAFDKFRTIITAFMLSSNYCEGTCKLIYV